MFVYHVFFFNLYDSKVLIFNIVYCQIYKMASSKDEMEGIHFKWLDDLEYENIFCEFCIKFIKKNEFCVI